MELRAARSALARSFLGRGPSSQVCVIFFRSSLFNIRTILPSPAIAVLEAAASPSDGSRVFDVVRFRGPAQQGAHCADDRPRIITARAEGSLASSGSTTRNITTSCTPQCHFSGG